jgi:formylmethanofuran dehydrogenase subunit E
MNQGIVSLLLLRMLTPHRVGLAGLKLLDIDPTIQQRNKHLMIISETDGCFVDGIEVTAQVSVGHRSLKIEDYGKIAATFVDLKSGRAVRLHPVPGARELALQYCQEEKRAYFAQLKAYQIIPDRQLLHTEWITLKQDLQQIVGSPRQRAYCIRCGEEVINGREILESGLPTCVACAGRAYYQSGEPAGILKFNADEIHTL